MSGMTHPTQFSPTASSASGQRDDGRLTMVARVDNAEKAQTMTASTLRSCTIKDLARMAKRRGVNGWHAMRKDQLVRALLRIAKAKPIESKSAKKIAPPVRRVVAAKNGSAGHPVVTHSRSSLNGSAHHGSAHVNGVRNGTPAVQSPATAPRPVAAWRTIVLRAFAEARPGSWPNGRGFRGGSSKPKCGSAVRRTWHSSSPTKN